jgi:serine/threonine protein kinase
MQPTNKPQVRFFAASRNQWNTPSVSLPNVYTVQQLGLKDKADARIGFKVQGTVIFAKQREGPRTPGAANHALESIFGRSKTRKLAAEAAMKRLEIRVNKLPPAEITSEVIVRLNDVRTQLTKWGTVAAQDLQSLFDSISDVEKTHTANQRQLQFNARVKESAAQLDTPAASAFIRALKSKNVTPPFAQTTINDFLTFIKHTAAANLDLIGANPLDYERARAFAQNWIRASPKPGLGEPKDRYLIDRLAKFVLEGCNLPTDGEPQGVPPQFSWIDDKTMQRTHDGALFERDDSVQFGEGGFGSISAYKCGTESVVVKELKRSAADPSLELKALAEARVHSQASEGADHIVGIHGTVPTPDGRLLLVLQHAPNGESATVRTNLDKAVIRGDLDPVSASRAKMLMLADMLKGALQAQENGVMHLDLKFENYLVDEQAKMLLCDFGASHGVLGDFGKPGIDSIDYTAPEINSPNQACMINHMSDVWSLGCMTYELFSPRKMDESFGVTALRPFPYKVSFEGRDSIDEFIKKGPPGRYKQLLLSPLGANQQLHRLIIAMLDPDPLKRPSLKEVLEHPLIARYANPKNDGDREIVRGARQTILAYARPAAS